MYSVHCTLYNALANYNYNCCAPIVSIWKAHQLVTRKAPGRFDVETPLTTVMGTQYVQFSFKLSSTNASSSMDVLVLFYDNYTKLTIIIPVPKERAGSLFQPVPGLGLGSAQ